MLYAIALFVSATLALFAFACYSAVRLRNNPDYRELRDDVDALMKERDSAKARERAALRRNREAVIDTADDSAPPRTDRPFGGVVRETVPAPDIAPRRRSTG